MKAICRQCGDEYKTYPSWEMMGLRGGCCSKQCRRAIRKALKPKKQTREDRFWGKVVKTESCWLWTGNKTPLGYGQLGRNHTGSNYVHRLSYEMTFGDIPEGLVIDHLCRNRNCVNPDHLEVVTQRENILRGDGVAAKNAKKTHCPNGHALSGDNLYTYNNGRHRRCRVCFIKNVRASRAKRMAEK